MISGIPVIGWLISFLFSVFLAIPFYFLWGHLAPTYFSFLPPAYVSIPYWDCVWLFMLLPILKFAIVPKLSSSSSSSRES